MFRTVPFRIPFRTERFFVFCTVPYSVRYFVLKDVLYDIRTVKIPYTVHVRYNFRTKDATGHRMDSAAICKITGQTDQKYLVG